MPALSYPDVVKDLKESYGTINAVQNGKEIFKSESVYYRLHGHTRFIIGHTGQNHVALCAPKDLAPEKPHTVVYPDDFTNLPRDYLRWTIEVEGNYHFVEKGTLTATFGPNHESAEGSYHVTLKGSREEVGGNFKMSNVCNTIP
jgi:hypothetical protein